MLSPIQVEAKYRLWLEDKVQPTNRYRTLFYGLRLNHPHNVAITHPLSFLLRRIIFSLIVVFMVNSAYSGVIILIGTCLYFQFFIITERPWESSIINQQHFVNECGLLFILAHLAMFNGLVMDVYARLWLGQFLIGVVCAIIIYNLIVILWHCFQMFAEMWSRHQKAYDRFFEGKCCYCFKKPVCYKSKPRDKYIAEPEPLPLPLEMTKFNGNMLAPLVECIPGVCEDGCNGMSGRAHLIVKAHCIEDICEPDCNGFQGEAHRFLRRECVAGVCSPICDGYTGSAHVIED